MAQAAIMMSQRLFQHQTIQQAAEEFGVSKETVSRRLALARREGIPEEARNIFIREMLPSAMAVVLDALKSPDERLRTQTAFKVIDGLEAMKVPEEERQARKLGAGEGDSYEVWRERVKVTRGSVAAAGAGNRPAGDTIIDATAVRVETGAEGSNEAAGADIAAALPPGEPGSDRS